uniref:Fungal-type protein kinase domain-containing protein n=1 Tax=Mycena chlorophos TaxID=658473 RepID=A0ABQ0MB86_MYCCL|nr:predicted protein [Mycena chlorophos]
MKQAVTAIFHASIGHQAAYKAGVRHREVRPGNVLLLNSLDFLHHVDVSSLTGAMTTKNKKAVTGTFAFLAIDLLDARCSKRSIKHEVHHDLESFFYLLVWFILRYTAHTRPEKERAAQFLFDPDDFRSLSAKVTWLMDEATKYTKGRLLVPTNVPLSTLIGRLATILREHHSFGCSTPPIPATHEDFIRCFTEALDAPGWPDESDVVAFTPPDPLQQAQSRYYEHLTRIELEPDFHMWAAPPKGVVEEVELGRGSDGEGVLPAMEDADEADESVFVETPEADALATRIAALRAELALELQQAQQARQSNRHHCSVQRN